jgi:hypothetical protein
MLHNLEIRRSASLAPPVCHCLFRGADHVAKIDPILATPPLLRGECIEDFYDLRDMLEREIVPMRIIVSDAALGSKGPRRRVDLDHQLVHIL